MSQFGLLSRFASLVLVLFGASTLATTVSITDAPAYAALRQCAQECIHFVNGPDAIADQISCNSPYQNDCICRADLQARVDAYLSSCVNRGCAADSVDIMSATSIYDAYCTGAGYTRAVATTPASATTGTTGTTSHTTATAITATATSTSSSGISNTNGSTSTSQATTFGGLTTAELIGVVVGIAGFLASAVGAWYTYKAVMQRREQHQEADRSQRGGDDSYRYPPRDEHNYRMKPVVASHITEWQTHSPPPQYGGYNYNR